MIKYKLFENLQKAKKILNDNNIDEKDPNFVNLKDMLSKNTGYLGQFTKWFFVDNTPIDQLEDIYKALKTIDIDKPIDDFEKPEELFDYIQNFEINQKVQQVIKSIPVRVREKLVTDDFINLITLNIEYAPKIKNMLSKKMVKFKTPEDLYQDTMWLIENLKGPFNLESIKQKIKEEGANITILSESDDSIVLRVNDYETSCKLGTKSWCISTSKSFWDKYVNPFSAQFFIFDFTKPISSREHAIGVTTSWEGKILNAHWANDDTVEDLSIINNF